MQSRQDTATKSYYLYHYFACLLDRKSLERQRKHGERQREGYDLQISSAGNQTMDNECMWYVLKLLGYQGSPPQKKTHFGTFEREITKRKLIKNRSRRGQDSITFSSGYGVKLLKHCILGLWVLYPVLLTVVLFAGSFAALQRGIEIICRVDVTLCENIVDESQFWVDGKKLFFIKIKIKIAYQFFCNL